MTPFDMLFGKGVDKTQLPDPDRALPDRPTATPVLAPHTVLGTSLPGPYPTGHDIAYFGLGCFWGAERLFWTLAGVHVTAVGYQGGMTANPSYEDVCSGRTGHAEMVLVAFDPHRISYDTLLKLFFEAHDPTQGMRQGADVGTQYRSALFCTTPTQLAAAGVARDAYQAQLRATGLGTITTEIAMAKPFYFAEGYHQQYLDKNPNGYCGLKGTGVTCPIGS